MQKPKIDKTAYVAKNACVLGDVEIGPDCSIWPFATIRGDMGKISIGKGANIQDNCVLHTDLQHEIKIGQNVTVGHACILHGCTVEDGALVGMGSIVLDGAVLGAGALLGAGSLLTSGTHIAPGTLAFGRPAKAVRQLSQEEKQKNLDNAKEYIELKNKQL